MIKKMMLLALAASALAAFAAPAAQATIKLTENGVALSNGAKVTATSTNLVTTTAGGNLVCANVTLHLEQTTNSGSSLTLKQEGAATTSGCGIVIEGVGTLPVTITDGTLGTGTGQEGKITINTWGTGTTGATFEAHIYKNAAHTELVRTCHYEGSVHVQATGGNLLTVGPSNLMSGSEGCSEVGTIEGNLALETANGTAVTVDYVATP